MTIVEVQLERLRRETSLCRLSPRSISELPRQLGIVSPVFWETQNSTLSKRVGAYWLIPSCSPRASSLGGDGSGRILMDRMRRPRRYPFWLQNASGVTFVSTESLSLKSTSMEALMLPTTVTTQLSCVEGPSPRCSRRSLRPLVFLTILAELLDATVKLLSVAPGQVM